MSDAAFLELLASYEAVLNIADGALRTARALAEAHRHPEPVPEEVIAEHLSATAQAQAQLAALRDQVLHLKAAFRVH
jgi:hypothetical protein